MPRIINTFASENPLAKTIGALGQSMFGDQLTPALKKQELADAQRKQLGIEELARTFGTAADGNVNFTRAAESGVLGGIKPEDVAMFTNFLAGNITGPRSVQTTDAMAGAGKYGDSAENLDLNRSNAFSMNEADNTTQRYGYDKTAETSLANNAADNSRLWQQFLQEPKPAMVGDKPSFLPQGNLVSSGAAPVVDNNQVSPVDQFRRYLTAADAAMPDAPPEAKRAWAVEQISKSKSKGVTVYGPDGQPIVEMGGSGFEPTNAVQTQLQKSQVNYDKFKATIGMARDVASKNPNIFGVVGIGRQAVQDSAQIAKSLGDVFGIKDIDGTLAGLQQDATARGIDPGVFSPKYDPALGQIESLGKILAYSGASTIAGQTGNGVSNKDVEAISAIIGDPRDWAMNQQRFLTKLQQVEDYVNSQMQVNSKYLFGQPGGAPSAAPAAQPAPGTAPAGLPDVSTMTDEQLKAIVNGP